MNIPPGLVDYTYMVAGAALFLAALFVIAWGTGLFDNGGKHKASRRHRPSGDLLWDQTRDDDPTDWLARLAATDDDRDTDRNVSIDGAWHGMPTVRWNPDIPPPQVPQEVIDRIAARTVAEAEGKR